MDNRPVQTLDPGVQNDRGTSPPPHGAERMPPRMGRATLPLPPPPPARRSIVYGGPSIGPDLGPDVPAMWSLPVWVLVVAAFAGAALAMVMIPTWVPTLGASITGAEPKVYWYLSRASGLTSFVLLWISMASGLLISNKLARIWPGAYTALDVHEFTSLLGLGFIVFHMLILLGNQYVPYTLMQLLLPFAGTGYRPLWVGLGQLALYITLLVTFTFYVRKQLTYRVWHLIHYLSYPVFGISLLHGLFSGTDSANPWVLGIYWAGALSLLLLTAYRVTVKKMATAR